MSTKYFNLHYYVLVYFIICSFTPMQHHIPIVNLFEISQSMQRENHTWDENQEYWAYSTTQETSTDATFSPSKQSNDPLLTTASTAYTDQPESTE